MDRRAVARALGAVFDKFPNDPLPLEVVFFMALHNLRTPLLEQEIVKKTILEYLQEDEQYSVVVIRQNASGEFRVSPLKKREER